MKANMPSSDQLVPLTEKDIEILTKRVTPIKTWLLIITFVFLIFAAIVVLNLPYLMVIIGVSVFPSITFGVFLYVYVITAFNIKSGKLQLITGNVEYKTTESGQFSGTGQSSIQSQMDLQTYYYIYVNKKKIEVDEDDYGQLKTGDPVELRMTMYNRMVIRVHKNPVKGDHL